MLREVMKYYWNVNIDNMSNFDKWERAFRAQNLYIFNNDKNGLLWLKTRAVCRSKQLNNFLEENKIKLSSNKVDEKFKELFALLEKRKDAFHILDNFLNCLNNEWYKSLGVDEDQLKDDLYRIHNYTWGGDQSNSLDKYYVSRYVKVISNFDVLQSKKREIADNAWNYIQNSWYNNWTSFLIESIFKKNPKVISAVGEIKSVDFFIEDFPLDLKVTFFPNQFMEEKIHSVLGKKTLSWLKFNCKELGITSDKKSSEAQQIYTLKERLSETGHNEIIQILNKTRRSIIEESRRNPIELMTWLYENQGEMRFGAENRIYLILADPDDFEASWKLKRAYSLIEPIVTTYLNSFSPHYLKQIKFQFKGNIYQTLSDSIFVIK